jgi:uracil phosphoribosyltransferase
MIIHDFSDDHSILNQFVSELRDLEVQKDPMRFRRNIERIGEILGYELSKTLSYKDEIIKTPLGSKQMGLSHEQIVLCSVMRAGTPLHHGLLNYFDHAENAFISAYRHHPDGDDNFEVIVEYLASPELDDKILVITDPMLATGRTLENVLIALKSHGSPKQIHIVSVIGSKDGIEYILPIFPENTHLWISAIDAELNNRGYIIPGLGDAGDLCYGSKI